MPINAACRNANVTDNKNKNETKDNQEVKAHNLGKKSIAPVIIISCIMVKLVHIINKLYTFIISRTVNLNYKYNYGLFLEVYIIMNSSILGILYFSKLSLFLFYIYLSLTVIYAILYVWRNLLFTLISFLAFLVNSSFFLLFMLGFYKLYTGIPNPIYIENLSIFSYYRYLVLLSIALLSIFLYLLLKANLLPTRLLSVSHFLTFPYFKEEMRKVLYTWNETIFGPICCTLSNYLVTSNVFAYIFFTVYFILFTLIRIVILSLFIDFTFFHGDLRYIIYLLPLSFILWLIRFFDYYFEIFRKETSNYICDVLLVEPITPFNSSELKKDIVWRNPKELNYTLSSFGLAEGYTKDNHLTLIKCWNDSATLQIRFLNYNKPVSYISKSIMFTFLFCWISIICKSNDFFIESTWNKFVIPLRGHFKPSRTLLARDSRWVKEQVMNDVKNKTQGAVSLGHPVYGEEKDGQYFVEGALTHGKGTTSNPSSEIRSKGFTDPKPINAIPNPNGAVAFPLSHFRSKVQGSEALDHPDVKNKLDKLSTPKDPKETKGSE